MQCMICTSAKLRFFAFKNASFICQMYCKWFFVESTLTSEWTLLKISLDLGKYRNLLHRYPGCRLWRIRFDDSSGTFQQNILDRICPKRWKQALNSSLLWIKFQNLKWFFLFQMAHQCRCHCHLHLQQLQEYLGSITKFYPTHTPLLIYPIGKCLRIM